MARYFGKVGYGTDVETAPGVWTTQITEKTYSGDVVRDFRRLQEGERVNKNLTTSTSISIVSDSYANANFSAIRYVEWEGVLWEVNVVDQEHPRLILQLGGVYNGPTS
jgi:hypothetical protein